MASMTFEPAPDGADPYLWLEDVTGAEALDWVRARNKPTTAAFCDAEFERMRVEALEVLDTDARIPYVNRRGNYLYNFWRDAANPRGVVAAHHAGQLPHRLAGLGCADRC